MNFLDQLNSSQRSAVQHFCGPMLVVAGAGSGKTRALTYRIANLIRRHRVDPENILAVTFTNKAAREMKERIEKLFAQELALEQFGQPLDSLAAHQQKQLLSKVYKTYTKPLWIGTFHSLFARILRFDINKYQDERGRTWERNFTIFDENDVMSLFKSIITKDLNLDQKKFDPRSMRYAISNLKNQGLSPNDYLAQAETTYKTRIIAEIYESYENQLAANNGLDFDDLIFIPVKLFQQNESILGYWHNQFRHILVDEYQDTNRIQYDLIRLLATNNEPDRHQWQWDGRSIFAVGDVDQSIYSFRMADFRILLEFQDDFGDGLPEDDTRTMIKLEENYRSRANILEAANKLIENNSQRIDKILKATRGEGEKIYCHQASTDQQEASFILHEIQKLRRDNPELDWGSFAVLYRINAQSRPVEDALIRANIPYTIVGGFKFYDRKEIKDALAYLRVIINPNDTVSLLRIINTPKRSIGKTTIDNLVNASQELAIPLWEILKDETSVNTIAGRAAKRVNQFSQLIQEWQTGLAQSKASEMLVQVLEQSDYLNDLRSKGNDEAEDRIENLNELLNAALQFEEENDENSLQDFLSQAALTSDLDNLQEETSTVSLMTLHSAKGLEFPVVFLAGMEQGLLPHFRSIDDPLQLEEERRLCYVGITRAQEQLFISHAQERFVWGSWERKLPSQFLDELPTELITSNKTTTRQKRLQRGPQAAGHKVTPTAIAQSQNNNLDSAIATSWKVGDQVHHKKFGDGHITHLLGSGRKTNLAIQFHDIGTKIIDPTIAKLERI
jgi:DNA helicase-2/ATP-dependent DNA helicase PcrA